MDVPLDDGLTLKLNGQSNATRNARRKVRKWRIRGKTDCASSSWIKVEASR
jgi:hypothetical protein